MRWPRDSSDSSGSIDGVSGVEALGLPCCWDWIPDPALDPVLSRECFYQYWNAGALASFNVSPNRRSTRCTAVCEVVEWGGGDKN